MQKKDMTSLAERLARLPPERLALLVRLLDARASVPPPRQRPAFEPIAIVGAACRFPGAANLDAYWRLLRDGTCAIDEVPRDRWDIDAFYDPDPSAAGKSYTRHGGFLSEIDRADIGFFRIDRREARTLDPHHTLLLEVAWEALEDAGIPAHTLSGSGAGIFLGITGSDQDSRVLRRDGAPGIDDSFATSTLSSMAAGRLAYMLGLHGPCLAVDTACTSSLVALHLACRSLQDHECEQALVGGVHLLLAPEMYIALSRARALSPDGRCRSFDAGASGYVRGEGCGVVVLKRLEDAQNHRDRILAVIRATAINHDGRGNGMRAPNGQAQEMVMRQALARAGVDPGDIAYVEAHGTASLLGDAIELTALSNVLAAPADAPPCGVGSVKGNIGHLEIAAGMASLIKAAFVLSRREVPATLHITEPNPQIDWSRSRLRLQRERGALPDQGRPALVGINAFSWSGTNAFSILEEPPPAPGVPASQPRPARTDAGVLTLSAHSVPALRAVARRHRDWLAASPQVDLTDLFYTASARRTQHDHRLAIVGRTHEELMARLDAFLAERPEAGTCIGRRALRGRPRIGFVFTGGAAILHGVQELLASRPELAELHAGWGRSPHRAAIAPLVQRLAMAELLRAWGVTPDAIMHEGEGALAAACCGGALGLGQALDMAGQDLAGHEAGGDLHAAIAEVKKPGTWMFVEIGPARSDAAYVPAGATRIPGWHDREAADGALARVLGAVHVVGVPVDWPSVHGSSGRLVPLPSYPWEPVPLGAQ